MSLINEAFKELKDVQGLDEELFSFDKKGATALDAFLDRSSEPVLNIIDPLAFDEEELQPDYTGNVICRCCVCKQLIYKKPEDVVIDEETQRVNVDEECPHCCNTGGFEVVGQVEPYVDKSEVKVTVDDDEVEVEDTETEEVTESLDEERPARTTRSKSNAPYYHAIKRALGVSDKTANSILKLYIQYSPDAFDEYPDPKDFEEFVKDDVFDLLDWAEDYRISGIDEIRTAIELRESLKELDESTSDEKEWGVWKDGGSIGEPKGLIERGLTKEEAQQKAKENNQARSKTDKDYYKLAYKAVKVSPWMLKDKDESLNESRTDDEIIDDYIGLKGTFKGYSEDEARQFYTTWNYRTHKPEDVAEIEDYTELKMTYHQEVEITGCDIFNEGDSPIDTFNKSYWEVEFNDGTSMSGVSGYNIDLYAFFNGELDFGESLNEDTIKQDNKWVNKGKAGTHGTFKTKKAADAQRKAMFASGYKGESLEEDLDEPDITLEEDDYTLDEKTGSISVDKQVFGDFVKDSYIKIHFTDDNDDDSYTEYKMVEETEDVIVMEYLGGPYGHMDESLDTSITIEVTEDDINFFDEETGDIIVDKTKFIGKEVKEGDYITIKFADENEDADTQDYKLIRETSDGFQLEWVGTKELHEDATDDFIETEYDPYKLSDEQRHVLQNISIKLRNQPHIRGFYDEVEAEEVALDAFLHPDARSDVSLPKFNSKKEATDYFYENIYDANFDKAVLRAVRGPFKSLSTPVKETKITEDFQKATVETGESILSMESDDSGKVTVTSEPRKIEEGGDEMIVPVSDEVQAEIEANSAEEEEVTGEAEETSEETTTEKEVVEEETTEEESTSEVEVDEFEESYFSSLGKKYLQEVYNNVSDFATTKGAIDGNKIKLEGIITFNSGKKVKTNFVFEGKEVTKKGKVRFLGENTQITPKKNAFTLNGTIKEGKLFVESLNYNYRAQDTSTGNRISLYGTVKR